MGNASNGFPQLFFYESCLLPTSQRSPVVVKWATDEPTGMIPQVGPSISRLQVISYVPWIKKKTTNTNYSLGKRSFGADVESQCKGGTKSTVGSDKKCTYSPHYNNNTLIRHQRGESFPAEDVEVMDARHGLVEPAAQASQDHNIQVLALQLFMWRSRCGGILVTLCCRRRLNQIPLPNKLYTLCKIGRVLIADLFHCNSLSCQSCRKIKGECYEG